MLFLMFELDRDRYAIECGRVDTVLPFIATKRLPHAPAAIAGIIDYRGHPVPLVDVSQLALGRAAHRRMSTRIAIVRHRDARGTERPLGLILERATDTFRCDAEAFRPSGVDHGDARYLGPVTAGPNGLVQWVTVDGLLTPEIAQLLFDPPLDA